MMVIIPAQIPTTSLMVPKPKVAPVPTIPATDTRSIMFIYLLPLGPK